MIHRVSSRIVVGAAVLVGAWLLWPRQPVAGQGPDGTMPPADAHYRYFGAASCSAMACHNFNGPKGLKGSEYSTWATSDRHARAFAVLSEERSNRMVKNLYPSETKLATETELCLKCHSTFTGKYDEKKNEMADASPRFRKEDGVSCEACHGAAEKWLTRHYQRDFKEMSIEQKKQLSWIETKDLGERARACAQCHVGDGSREVNHDLIAAGHPRLNFELSAFHGIMQKHWDDKKKGANGELLQPDFESRLWLVGQLATARSALDLLAVRADSADKKAAEGGRPWPEFAEYACYACHKDLSVIDSKAPSRYENRHPGSFSYGTWYLSMVPEAAAQTMKDSKALTARLDAVRAEMQRATPDAKKVGDEAKAASKLLDEAIREASAAPLGGAKVKDCMRSFVKHGISKPDAINDWDNASQLYLSLAAQYQALSDRGQGDANLKNALLGVKKPLRSSFPPDYDSPQLYKASTILDVRKQLELIDGLLGK